MPSTLGLNDRVVPLIDALKRDADELRIAVHRGARGETVIDVGIAAPSSVAAGVAVAEIAMGGLSDVAISASGDLEAGGLRVEVRSSQPVLACLGSQLAGWQLVDEPTRFRALGSGPARALAAQESVFAEMGWKDAAPRGVLVLECDRVPPPAVTDAVAEACGLHPSKLTFVLVPVTSLAGCVQVAARCLETAVGKAHRAGFPLADLIDGVATCPLAPPHPDPLVSMGRTNDGILYGGRVHLFATGPTGAARDLATHLPSQASQQHGRPFADVLRDAGGDFYAVDPLLFGPAWVSVTALSTGETFTAGAVRSDLVRWSFSSPTS